MVALASQPCLADGRVSIADGRVSFIPPADFKPLTKEQIALKYLRTASPPDYVYANDRQSVSIAITFSPARLAPEQMPEYKQAMEELLPKLLPGLKWLTREFVMIGGRKWLHFEITTPAIDTTIHNDLYSTSFEGKALMFNFNSTVEQYPKVKDLLNRSKDSIILKETGRAKT